MTQKLLCILLLLFCNIVSARATKDIKKVPVDIKRFWQCGYDPTMNNCTQEEIAKSRAWFKKKKPKQIIARLKKRGIKASPTDIRKIKAGKMERKEEEIEEEKKVQQQDILEQSLG